MQATYIYIYRHTHTYIGIYTTNETIFLAHINLSIGSACQNALCSADDATKAETAAVRRLSIMLSVLGLGAVQIELSIWQHRIALQLCVAHCLRSLSSLRCGVEKSLRTTNETIFLAHINLSIGSACQNALCSADNATKAETAAVRRFSRHIYIWATITHINISNSI